MDAEIDRSIRRRSQVAAEVALAWVRKEMKDGEAFIPDWQKYQADAKAPWKDFET